MNRILKYFLITICFIAVVFSCSTEKNTLINRSYHGLTAHYNGYFNANILIDLSISNYRANLQENYYDILPIDPVPSKTEVIGLYSSIDTAIAKCTKVIQNHSMPSNDRPSKKKVEYNPWIDENWTTVGIADFYRRDYEGAIKNFDFVKKFYSKDPSLFIADLWLAKSNIALGNYSDALFNFKNIDKGLEEDSILCAENKGFKKISKLFAKKDKTVKDEKPIKFPKKIKFDIEKTRADLALKKNNTEDAIKALEKSLEFAKKQGDKARVHFILAQLYETVGKRTQAKEHFSKVLKYNAPYPMIFSARIKRAFMGGDEKLRKQLMRMLKDAKNAEFKDQIYYALADMELQEGNKPKAKEYLTSSAFYSTSNTRQKGMAYEKLGNLSFTERNYVIAQKYYDSCVTVIDDTYPNAEGVRNKALKLADLVKAVETYEFEDSVQRIANLSESGRIEFVENVIKKIKKDEERRKIMEAERLVQLQKTQSAQSNEGNGNKWYWNNPKTKSEGFDEFKKLWGIRVNEDNWRRSEKTSTYIPDDPENDTSVVLTDTAKVVEDTLTVANLMKRIPLTDSAKAISTVRMLSSLYDAGVIYKDQLLENEMAIKQFNAVLDRHLESDFNLLSSYQLYRMYSETDKAKAAIQKEYILNMYPNSDYANYLRDPDYFIKKKERDALAEQEYVSVLDRYKRGLYAPVISKATIVIDSEKDNVYRAKYMLLKALSMGQISDNKQEMVPVLDQIILDYPKSEEEARATELLTILKDGVSLNTLLDFSNKSIYTYNDGASHYVLVFLEKEVSSIVEKTKVSNFNREFFSRDQLKTSSKLYGDNQSVVFIEEFETDLKAIEYIRVFKNTRKHLLDLQKAKIVAITRDNLKILFETQKLQEYEDFMLEFY